MLDKDYNDYANAEAFLVTYKDHSGRKNFLLTPDKHPSVSASVSKIVNGIDNPFILPTVGLYPLNFNNNKRFTTFLPIENPVAADMLNSMSLN